MAIKHDGGSAFPIGELRTVSGDIYQLANSGMSLRDWFAGQALPSLIARHRADVAWSEVSPTAYFIADAMLKTRDGG